MSKKIVIACLLALMPAWMWALDSEQAKEVVENYYNSLEMYAQTPGSNPKVITQWFAAENVVFNDIYGPLKNDYSSHNKCAIKDYVTYVGGYYNTYGAKLSITHRTTGYTCNNTGSNGRSEEYVVYATKTIRGNGTKPLNLTTYEKLTVREGYNAPLIYKIEKMDSPFTSSSRDCKPITTTTPTRPTQTTTMPTPTPTPTQPTTTSTGSTGTVSTWSAINTTPAPPAKINKDDYVTSREKQKSQWLPRYYEHSGLSTLSFFSVGYTYSFMGTNHIVNASLLDFRVSIVGLSWLNVEMSAWPFDKRFAYKPALRFYLPVGKCFAFVPYGGAEVDASYLATYIDKQYTYDVTNDFYVNAYAGLALNLSAQNVFAAEIKIEYRHPVRVPTNGALNPQGVYVGAQIYFCKTFKKE